MLAAGSPGTMTAPSSPPASVARTNPGAARPSPSRHGRKGNCLAGYPSPASRKNFGEDGGGEVSAEAATSPLDRKTGYHRARAPAIARKCSWRIGCLTGTRRGLFVAIHDEDLYASSLHVRAIPGTPCFACARRRESRAGNLHIRAQHCSPKRHPWCRPSRISRVPRSSASDVLCVTNTMVGRDSSHNRLQLFLQTARVEGSSALKASSMQQYRRLHHQRLGDGDPLLHAAGKLMRIFVHVLRAQAHALEKRAVLLRCSLRRKRQNGGRSRPRNGCMRVLRPIHHITQNRAIGKQRILLRHITATRIDARHRLAIHR